jgi:hypothetical protein
LYDVPQVLFASIIRVMALMMEAVSNSEMSINFYQNTWCIIPEDSHLHTHHHENLKSHQTMYKNLKTHVFIFISQTKIGKISEKYSVKDLGC